MWATRHERDEQFRATTCERVPADPGDIRFELGVYTDGMEETPYWVESIDDTGAIVATDVYATQAERSEMIASFRYHQAVPFEVEFAPFGPAWQREQDERKGQ